MHDIIRMLLVTSDSDLIASLALETEGVEDLIEKGYLANRNPNEPGVAPRLYVTLTGIGHIANYLRGCTEPDRPAEQVQ